MHFRTTLAMLALTAAMLCSPATAQIINVQGPDGPMQFPGGVRQFKTGTGIVKGRVTSADTGTPLRRVQVRLSGPEVMPKSATTDGEGRYEFRDLPSGRFTITATKSSYVTVSYGQTRPFEAAKPIELIEGQVLEKADILMPRGSAIEGRIVDEYGEPIADVAVAAMRSTWVSGRRRLQATGRTATTNDRGQYRIYGLPPGEYYVSATLRGGAEMMMVEGAVFASMSGGPAPETPRSGYAPTYYPGTANGGEAGKISVALGQEAQNTDFGLVPVRLAKVTGTVIGSNGTPLQGVMVQAMPRNPQAGAFMPMSGGGRTDSNGNFTITGVAPGEYTLNARSAQIFTQTDGDRMTVTMTRVQIAGDSGASQSEFGSVPLTVSGEDVENVMIPTSKGTSVSGRVTYEGGTRPTVSTLRINASSPEADGPLGIVGGSASVTPEGTFEIKGIAGPRIFRVTNVPAGWVLKSILLNGSDVTDTGIDVRPSEPLTGLEVVLSNKQTEVSGTVKSGNDPATDYTVVVFSDDPAKWTVPTMRYIASARPNQDGRFQLKNLPAGGYYVVALDYIAQGDWFDPEVLERLKARAERFTLDEGEIETLDLPLQGSQ